jgi:FkbM family methyltransferase
MTKTIYDLGMCYAEDTTFYLKKGFQVVAIEANPGAVAQAQTQLSDYVESGALTIVNKAISDEPITIPFYICDDKIWLSTASKERAEQWERGGEVFRKVDVSSTHLRDLFANFPAPHYVKIDIEGFDLVALKQIADSPVRPAYISAELDIARSQEMLRLLRSMGYKRFALVYQSHVPSQIEPSPAREGQHSGAPIVKGQTGLFGDDLPDHGWRQADAMRWSLLWLRVECLAAAVTLKLGALLRAQDLANRIVTRAFSRHGDWYDIHARRN